MDVIFPFLSPAGLTFALFIAFLAGFVKGVVGFALPLVLISGLTLYIAPELALAGLIVPTLVTNIVQSLRQGARAAWESAKSFRYFLIAGGITLIIAAQFVRVVPEAFLQLVIGIPSVTYAVTQLGGFKFSLNGHNRVVEAIVGMITGVLGGFAGVWGAPTVMYLTALDTPKLDQIRIQGVIYGGGSMALAGAHLGSGVLRSETLPFSLVLVLPALIGMWAGGKVMDHIDQVMFKRATLMVLLIAGANLIRRAVF